MPEDKDIKPPLPADDETARNVTSRRGWLPNWLRWPKSQTLPVVKIEAPNAFYVETEIPPRKPSSTAEIAKAILYLGAYFQAVVIGCLIVFLCISEMRLHFVNLMWRSWNAFINSQGSTTLGWVSSTIVVPVLAVAATVFLIRQRRGRKAMLSHWRQDAVVTLQVIAFAVIFYYGPIFIWKGIIRTIYDDHRLLVAQNQSLTHRQPEVRVQYVTPDQPKESPNSLRRRTLRLADELTDFAIKSRESSPPVAVPDSRDPNPSDEKKAAMKNYRDYWENVEKMYMRKYRDRAVGIVKEYNAKGVPTGYLENDFRQRPPYVAAGTLVEFTQGDDLFWLRQLAYCVDANDNAIHLDY